MLRRLFTDSRGATAIEYSLIAALIAVAGIFSFDALAVALTNLMLLIASYL
ncbi:MAG: Flp family type IVb pilin [Hyphomicrobiaceae bacterium]